KLEELNVKRRELTENAVEGIINDVIDENNLPYLIIAEDPNWHVGIVGLIAGRIVEKFARPTIIMQDFGDFLVASARSPENFNVIQAISSCKDLLETFGGHHCAAGLKIKKSNLKEFKE